MPKKTPRKRKPARRKKRPTSQKRQSPAGKNTGRPRARRKSVRAGAGRKWVGRLLILLLVASGAWVAWLDYQIQSQFEGKRWSLPAIVYASPLELYVGRELSVAAYKRELKRLGYRYKYRAREPGTYTFEGERFEVYRRDFDFWDGDIEARLLRIGFDNGRISVLADARSGEALDVERMEPARIGGLYPAHREERILIRLEQAPETLRRGLIAVEDRDFYRHHGVAPKAILRALLANLRQGRAAQGGSTLTQQLVKNYFLSNERSLWRKANEDIMAMLLDLHYGKDEILQAYLNEIYLGQQGRQAIHGFGLASRFYFDRPVEKLDLAQVATLIALVRGPSYYNPQRHPRRLLERRKLVLDLMVSQGVIDKFQAEKARRAKLNIVAGRRGNSDYPAFLDLVRRQLQHDYRPADLTTEGLNIFTTLDPEIQRVSERRLASRLKQLDRSTRNKPALQGAVVVTNTTNGEVMALVGDRDPRFAGFNRALDAVRPIGSLIKPVIYLTALLQPQRYTLSTPLDDSPIHLKGRDNEIWSPRNYDGRSHGTVPLFMALVNSYNQATVRLGLELGFEAIAETMKQLGAEHELPPYPAMLLGASGFSPLEMSRVYQTLASGGFRSPVKVIREVTTAEGRPLRRFPLKISQAIDPATVAVLQSALQEVTRTGTARSIQKRLPAELRVAGKTGTTNDLRDSWFAGYSGNTLTVVWLGRDDNRSTGLTGSSGALVVWTDIMQAIPNIPLSLSRLDEVEYHWIDRQTGLLSTENCATAVYLGFIRGTAPQEKARCTQKRSPSAIDWFKRLFK